MQVMIHVFPVIKIMLLLERKVSKLALSYVNTSDSGAAVPRYASQWRPSTQKFHEIRFRVRGLRPPRLGVNRPPTTGTH